jgi:diguanylate cyclase (GGDEF)-like protein/excisionase family DNA binding protein
MSSHPGPSGPSLTTQGASRLLGVHPNTMRAWADQGRVRCLRVNARGDRRFRLADLQAFMAAAEAQRAHGARTHADLATGGGALEDAVERLAQGLAGHLDPASLVPALTEGARRVFGAREALLLRLSGDGTPVPLAGARGAADAVAASPPKGHSRLAALAASAASAAPSLRDPAAPAIALPDSGTPARSAACPVALSEIETGLLVLRRGRRDWSARELAALRSLASWASVALRNAGRYQRMAVWAAQLESIQQLGTRLNRLSSVDDIGTAICSELRQLIDYHNVRVYRIDGEDVLPVAWRGEIGEYIGESGDELRLRVGHGITGWVARHGVAQYLPDAARDPRAATIPGTAPDLDESMLLAPMVYDDRVLGVIVLSKLGLDRFDPDDLRYLVIYASIAAQAIANADSTEQLRAQSETLARQLESQRQLLSVTESILSELDPVAVVEQIADRLGGLVPVDNLAVVVHEPETRTLRPLLARGVHASAFMARPIPDDSGISGWVQHHGVAQLVQDELADPRVRQLDGLGPQAGALIVAPLRARRRTLGVLTLERLGRDARFALEEFELIQLFAAHVSIALENALAHHAVELRAQTDALTGLRNQGTFREELSLAVARGETFSLLMLDLDDFKSFNDEHGHEAGNELLQALAQALRAACRGSDEVYRYGGDEFALLLPGTSTLGALGVASRVRRAVRETPDPATGQPAGMRCSLGVASYPEDGSDHGALLLSADRACYAAKRSGRDRVATAAEGMALAGESMPRTTPVDETQPPRG